MSRFTEGRNVINKVNKQLSYGIELQQMLEEKRQQKLKKLRGNK